MDRMFNDTQIADKTLRLDCNMPDFSSRSRGGQNGTKDIFSRVMGKNFLLKKTKQTGQNTSS